MSVHPRVPSSYYFDVTTRNIDGAGTDRSVLLAFWFPGDFEQPRYAFSLEGPFGMNSLIEFELGQQGDSLFDCEEVTFHLDPRSPGQGHTWYPARFQMVGEPHGAPRKYCLFDASDVVTDARDDGYVSKQLVHDDVIGEGTTHPSSSTSRTKAVETSWPKLPPHRQR